MPKTNYRFPQKEVVEYFRNFIDDSAEILRKILLFIRQFRTESATLYKYGGQ
jgi:hypothetical protein